MTSFWHPFADMHAVETNGSTTLVRGEGAYVIDDTGRRYLDATASLWYCNVGWGRAEIADAVAAQMRELPAYSAFGDLTNRPAEALAERVVVARTGRGLEGLPHQRGLGLDRHRHEDGPPVLAAARQSPSAPC